MKVILFDASTLISLSMAGFLFELRKLKENFSGKFIVTKEVEDEVVTTPLHIRRFELEAIRVRQLLDDGVLERPKALSVSQTEISKRTKKFMSLANSFYSAKNKHIDIIHSGETSCLALSQILTEKKVPNLIAMDERTTRVLVERPENLQSLLEHRLHMKIRMDKHHVKFLKGFHIIRSTELIYLAYKKGLLRIKGKGVLKALLFALKHRGSAITDKEIFEIVQRKA